jgi:hypothetical protein
VPHHHDGDERRADAQIPEAVSHDGVPACYRGAVGGAG